MAKSANQRSSIYEGTDGYWHGWVTVGVKANGKPDRRHRMAKTQAEVTEKVRDLERKRDAGQVSKASRKKMTVGQWAVIWLTEVAPRTASESTIESVYRPRLVNWILPRIGHQKLERLGPEHLDALYLEVARDGLSEKSVLMVHQIIKRMLKMAMRRNLVGRNVADLVDSPSHDDSDFDALEELEAKTILRHSANVRNGARWSVAFALGLRQAEALGMRWKYLDLDAGRVQVWQLKRTRFRHGCDDVAECTKNRHRDVCRAGCDKHARYCPARTGGEWVFRKPKGKKVRWVPIPVELVDQLRTHRAAQAAERLAAGTSWEDWDLVFADQRGRPINPRRDWAEFKAMLASSGIRDARPHDARHTAATLLLEQGVDIRVVQEILGHASLAVTKRYAHVRDKLTRDAAEKMGKALWS
ncbi:site-specific integrase [Kribbella sp. VKM Ac-2566]|uniref:tyrosine-type recombinase/integrase n=1 Tax=Kribbella sp. VKM Ac-2566 TaxID=2512218 RepID=UPI0010EC4F64|nr:site-specific integrase [Kribbella sp. VKM Ac-2566]TDW91275.1 site-specific recombinase XerD [Kribbella sp. VKM Ac-2566]